MNDFPANPRRRFLQFSLRGLLLLVLVIGVAIALTAPAWKQVTCVNARDITHGVQILGTFGQPLGSVFAIQGEWIRTPFGNLKFRVTHLNGKPLAQQPELALVRSILPPFQGRGPKTGESFDWRLDFGGSTPGPTPNEGEKWEMRGAETGILNSYSNDVVAATGGPLLQVSPDTAGFATPFEYIEVRKIP